MSYKSSVLIRWGLAFVFLYAGVMSMIQPLEWVGYFPPFLLQIFPQSLLLLSFSIAEILLAVWLVWGKYARAAGWVAFVMLFGITVANAGIFDVVFRDVGLAFAALALVIDTDNK